MAGVGYADGWKRVRITGKLPKNITFSSWSQLITSKDINYSQNMSSDLFRVSNKEKGRISKRR